MARSVADIVPPGGLFFVAVEEELLREPPMIQGVLL
jgi:hypothetical protein